MWRLFLIVAVLALAAGTLFRLAATLDLPALRMLGFWALVAVGLLMARAIRQQQSAAGQGEVARALERLGDRWQVARSSRAGAVLVGPGGVCVLAFDEMADYGYGRHAARRLAAARTRADRAADAVRAQLAGFAATSPVPVEPCLVLLRRRAPETGGSPLQHGEVAVVNPEGLAEFLGRLARRGGLQAPEQAALLAYLQDAV